MQEKRSLAHLQGAQSTTVYDILVSERSNGVLVVMRRMLEVCGRHGRSCKTQLRLWMRDSVDSSAVGALLQGTIHYNIGGDVERARGQAFLRLQGIGVREEF